jgi:hypothetical protein
VVLDEVEKFDRSRPRRQEPYEPTSTGCVKLHDGR